MDDERDRVPAGVPGEPEESDTARLDDLATAAEAAEVEESDGDVEDAAAAGVVSLPNEAAWLTGRDGAGE